MRGSEVTSYTYDGSLVTADTRSGVLPATLSFTYDTDFRPTSFSYAGTATSFAYDADSLLTRAGEYTISRDASSGLPFSLTAPGFALTRGFSPYGELDDTTLTVAGTDAYGYSLTRDTAGRITSRTERLGGNTRTLAFAYDLAGRLTTITAEGETLEAYRYDANGNRTHAFVPARGLDATITFDAADRIATSAEATYTTDADGFLTSKETSAGTTTYRYSGLGELTSVTLPSGREVTYAYDAFSRRVSRSIDGTLTERYLWADATHLLAVYPASGTTPLYRFTYADGRMPVSVETSQGTLRLVTDQVGTVRALVASDGVITQWVERDSYGAVTSGATDFPLGFAGGLADADTGLTHFGAREYDPQAGRWMSRDPIDFAGGDANLFGYVLGDPVGGVDPGGLYTFGLGGGGDAGYFRAAGASGSWEFVESIDKPGDWGTAVTHSTYWEGVNDPPAGKGNDPWAFIAALGAGVQLQLTDAQPEELCGESDRYGITLFWVTFDYMTFQDHHGAQASFGPGIPFDVHHFHETTTFYPKKWIP